MQLSSSRARTVLVAALVTFSLLTVVPATSGVPTDTYAQTGADEEPNDDVANATAADTSRAINGEISGEEDVDYYAIDLREDSQVEISQGIGGGALPVTLLDRDREVVGQIADQDSFEGEEDLIRANANYTGTYYLRVEGDPGEEYSIGVRTTDPDANEPNDGFGSATAIESGERVVGTVVTGDRDVFAIDADAGEAIDVIGNATAAARVTVYGPDESALADETLPSPGGVFESEQGYGTPVVSATAAGDGTHYVAVAIEDETIGNVNGPYNLTVTTSGEGSGSAAENETTTDESSTDATDEDATETISGSDGTTTDDGAESGSGTDADSGTPTTTDTTTEEATTTEETAVDENDATTAADTSTAGGESSATTETTDAAENATVQAGSEATSDAPTGTTTGGQDDVSEDVEETAVNGPGFGIVAALVALLGAALLATRRN